ncbi:MAG: phenylalanine--tRNA ligase beta subunit-related protein [Bacteroidales bacterium]|nr:phenylalanine--tRNA ligase beta subunit-related protein [Bacteroidales bacterium]
MVVSDELRAAWPQFIGGAVMATFTNNAYSDGLWHEIHECEADLRGRLTTDTLKHVGSIEATRRAYRACGKDPNRYRPSSEQLVRRILQGKSLYQIDTCVDLVNLASMRSGYSIGGFDADRIKGDTLTLGIGHEGEPYEGIGRGVLNIAGLPVYRDAIGGIGTPTSDHERTKLSLATTTLLALVNGYDGDADAVARCQDDIVALLRAYTLCSEWDTWRY